jgi:hypothetical protein
MSSFTTPLELEYIDGFNWKVTAEFAFESEIAKRTIHVPAGFVTDFASIPRFLWNLLPPTGQYGKAAVVHDYCYRTLGFVTKSIADQVFREGMIVLGVPSWKINTIYYAVKFFGRRAYKGGL